MTTDIGIFLVGILGLAGSIFAGLMAWNASSTARDTAKEVARMTGSFNKELKDHEYRLAHIQKIVSKRIEACDELVTLAAKLTQYATFEKITFYEWKDLEQFGTEWVNAYHLSFWLEGARQVQYANIFSTVASVLVEVLDMPESERQAKLDEILDRRNINFEGLAVDFIDGVREDYLNLDRLGLLDRPQK